MQQQQFLTPQQQQKIQDLMNAAFETRMKKEPFPNEGVDFIKSQFMTVLKHFGFNTINIQSHELKVIGDKEQDYSYFEVGTMLNCIMGASFEKNEVVGGIADAAAFIAKIEPLQDLYNEYVAKCRRASQSEIKTKLQLTNDPLAKYL